MDRKEALALAQKLNELGRYDLSDKLLADPDKFDFSQLENSPEFTEKYKNIYDFLGDKERALVDLYRDLDGKLPSKARLAAFQKKHPDISESEVKAWFDQTNKYVEYYKQERAEAAGRVRREREIRDLGFFRDLLTSDYSKRRYIDDPQTSVLSSKLFGGKGEFNPYTTEGARDIRDEILGGVGAILDVVPTPIASDVWGGPLVRGLRDAAHLDEPYKPKSPIQDMFMDVGINYGTNFLPTALVRKFAKGTRGTAKASTYFGDAARAADVELRKEAVDRSLKMLDELLTKNPNIDNVTLKNAVESLPDSDLKAGILGDIASGKSVAEAVVDWRSKMSTAMNTDVVKMRQAKAAKDGTVPTATTQLEKDIAFKPRLGRVQNVLKFGIKSEQPVVSGAAKVIGHKKVTHTSDEDSGTIAMLKEKNDRFWRAGFAPKAVEGDPLWEAYKEWAAENGVERKEDTYDKWQKRLGGKK